MSRHLLVLTASLAFLAPWTPLAPAAGVTDGYLDQAALRAEVQDLGAHASCRVERMGVSAAGREVFLLTLAGDDDDARRPALLIAAGLDGRHLVGTETALRVARRLLEEHAALLDEVTVYVVPRVNPDAAEANLGAVNAGHVGTFRARDDDHDGADDEDGPRDLDGNGVITTMRRAEPALDTTALHAPTHVADPAAPRLLKKADGAKGERATYAVYPEGLDADGDGAIAEDPPGAVDLDRNFMHRWPEHAPDAGPYQLSEPEAHAVARFVLEHPNVMAAIVYGRHDNVVNPPKGTKKDVTGRAPLDVHEDDVAMYAAIGERYRELTEQERAPEEDSAGALHAWLYAQRGIPTFATVVWGRPDASEGDGDGDGDADAHTDTDTDADADADTDTDAHADAGPHADADNDAKPADAEAAAWLEYSDRDRAGAGFVEWTPFDHPTLGPVEIGGFVPGFRMNPPADELDALAEKQTAFALDLIERRPQIAFEGPTTKRLAGGLYEIRFGIVNDGYFPTTTAMARAARSVLPTIVRLSIPIERIVSGDRVTRFWSLDRSRGRASVRWMIRATEGERVSIEIVSPLAGPRTVDLEMP